MNETRTDSQVADLPSNVYRLADRIRLRNELARARAGQVSPLPAARAPVVVWDSWYHEEALRQPDPGPLPPKI
jgi:hypothetical protein